MLYLLSVTNQTNVSSLSLPFHSSLFTFNYLKLLFSSCLMNSELWEGEVDTLCIE